MSEQAEKVQAYEMSETAIATEEMQEVFAVLTYVDQGQHEIDRAVSNLLERLAPILRPEQDSPDVNKQAEPKPERSPLGERLNDLNISQRFTLRRLDQIRERLAV